MSSAASSGRDALARRGDAGTDERRQSSEPEVRLSLTEHLEELRVRVKWAVVSIIGGVVVCYGFSEWIFHWLMTPVFDALPEGDKQLVFTSAIEPLWVYLKVGAYAGLFASSPLVLWQAWKFIAPGLYSSERRLAAPFVVLGTAFFVAGGAFCRYAILPFAFGYLVGEFTTVNLRAMLTMQEQLSLVLTLVLAFGIIFELPLILTMLARLGLVKSSFLTKYRRWAIVFNTVLAAIITPTGDPFNLALMAIPLMICYELGVLGAKLVEKKDDADTTGESNESAA